MTSFGNFSGFAVQTDAQSCGFFRKISLRGEPSDQSGEHIAATGLG